MAGTVLRKSGVVLLIILRRMVRIAAMALRLLCGGIKLFLLLLSMAMRLVLAVVGIADAA